MAGISRVLKSTGKQIPAPKGYYTVLYIDRNPAKDLVDQDLEGKDFTFYPSKAEMLPDGTLKFLTVSVSETLKQYGR